MSTEIKPLVVQGVLESLPALRRYTMDASASAGLTPEQSYGLSLAIDEIATNIAIHGYRKNGLAGNISIRAEIRGDGLVVVMEDTSPEFDARKLAAARPEHIDKPMEERPIGGLGVYLAMQNVDGFDYKRVGNVNHNVFTMKRPHNG